MNNETDTTVTRHGLTWQKNVGRSIDPMATGTGYDAPPRFTLYNYTEKNESEFFSHVFPLSLVVAIAQATTNIGRVC